MGKIEIKISVKIFFLIITGLLSAIAPNLYAGDSYSGKTLVMVSGIPEGSAVEQFVREIYTDAFQRLGIKMIYQFYPFTRATSLVLNKKVDGDLTRVISYGNRYPHLVRVEEPAYTDRFSAFATNSSIRFRGWESLRGTTLRIDYQRGIQGIEQHIRSLVSSSRITPLSIDAQGLNKLILGRTDVFISSEYFVMSLLHNDMFRNSGIRKVGVMQEIHLYAYLLNKHRELAPKLASILRQMKTEGLIKQYILHALEE